MEPYIEPHSELSVRAMLPMHSSMSTAEGPEYKMLADGPAEVVLTSKCEAQA